MVECNGSTTLCAVIGNPITHTLSPCMHNAAYAATGLNYMYVAFATTDLQAAVAGMKGLRIRGFSVTIPHKIEIMRYLDEVAPLAQRIGAVNTVTNDNGILHGTNTDGYGALHALEALESLCGKSVVILGAGGAARAIAFTIAHERNLRRLVLVGRNPDKVDSLVRDLSRDSGTPIVSTTFARDALREAFAEADIIINTTPVGMTPNIAETPAPGDFFSERHLVFDTIYNPAKTRLLLEAERRAARILNGVPMFVYQGAVQFRLWTGLEPPILEMRSAVERALGTS
jgi:shikimate dehydrogenase